MRLIVCTLALAVLAAFVVDRVFFTGTSSAAPGRTLPVRVPGFVFSGDFDTGNLSQWTWGAQCANTGVAASAGSATGTVTVESQIVGQGTHAAEFTLPATQLSNSCETLVKRQIGLGTDDYYGLMVRFPADWREPSPAGWGLAIAQFNFEGIAGAPILLAAHGDHVSLVMQTGLCRTIATTTPGCAFSSGPGGNVAPMLAVPAPLALGVWHELIVHVHWAAGSGGAIDVWHRLLGAKRWKKTVSLRGRPTVQWTDAGPAGLAGSVTSDKIGAYRGYASFPITIWQDGFVRTGSFAATAATLP